MKKFKGIYIGKNTGFFPKKIYVTGNVLYYGVARTGNTVALGGRLTKD